jgi:hypothetical protein
MIFVVFAVLTVQKEGESTLVAKNMWIKLLLKP